MILRSISVYKELQTPTNLFLTSLAVTDLLIALFLPIHEVSTNLMLNHQLSFSQYSSFPVYRRILYILQNHKKAIDKIQKQHVTASGKWTQDFAALHATIWVNSPYFLEVTRSLSMHALLIFELLGINRTWVYKDLKGWDFHRMRN